MSQIFDSTAIHAPVYDFESNLLAAPFILFLEQFKVVMIVVMVSRAVTASAQRCEWKKLPSLTEGRIVGFSARRRVPLLYEPIMAALFFLTNLCRNQCIFFPWLVRFWSKNTDILLLLLGTA